ncbi:SGNH/GDSL hydrolase family protein [Cryomorphaceae bacterium 1068]|nr:SGNH/GDSL hydrolase family protein [Cryomorphaceae bacterium 1068]
MNIRYISGAVISFPLLPFMYFQGKRIRASVPKLPEAEGIEGHCSNQKSGNTLTVISIGESTIAGVGVRTHEEGFTGTFAKEISRLYNRSVQWKVYARSGYTAGSVDKKLIPEITENQADLIVIGLGGNDAFTLSRPSKWKADIHSLIESLRSKFPKAIIVFCHMPPIKEFPAFTPLIKFTIGNLVEILGEELRKVVSQYQNVFYLGEKITLKRWIDKFDLKAGKEDFFSDGVHPSKLTYQTWAKDIAGGVFANENIKTALQQSV